MVDEQREYLGWSDQEVNMSTGIVAGKRALNNLHYRLGKEGFDQVQLFILTLTFTMLWLPYFLWLGSYENNILYDENNSQ